jgi:dipeptidyl aminopeptidase/acylaminoacyl peptidase
MSLGAFRNSVLVLLFLVALLWVVAPIARTALLFISAPGRTAPSPPGGLHVEPVTFPASDGVRLSGWFVPAAHAAPTIVLVSGFKDNRASMVPYARMLSRAGYDVLLYDSRGTGGSAGTFGLGLREVADVTGAIDFLNHGHMTSVRRYGVLGVSLGSGDAIVAADREPRVRAVAADSPYVDQNAVVNHADSFHFRRLTVPLAPLGPWVADRILGAPLSSFSPLHAIGHLAPRHVLLIHSRHDANSTTPLSAALALERAGGSTTSLWIAPRGGHAGAYSAQPRVYAAHVLGFFRRYLGRP